MPAPTFNYEFDYTLARDRIRLLIGDTDNNDRLLFDQEIAQYVTGGDTQDEAADYQSAARAATAISLKFVRQVQSMSAGGTSIVFDILNGRAKFYEKLSATLAKGPVASAPRPFLGGTSRADKLTRESDTDRVAPAFVRGPSEHYERSDDRYWP